MVVLDWGCHSGSHSPLCHDGDGPVHDDSNRVYHVSRERRCVELGY
jgi:hypothetical protein